ncbi:hypothetical protein DXG03_005551 [Asterophora parasitica]|uniref:DNL-type domain-containing protein n=1 Tax=Asterophora parasitica TaxID=117018 RepID=A0A9P7G5V2_9AGAR|nr:hypothetical protein DXG03_005551 [Asterophora parasitica]
MLPSRLFRNTGLPPALRSLLAPHASLPSTIAVQLRFRLGVFRNTHTSHPLPAPAASTSATSSFSSSSSSSSSSASLPSSSSSPDSSAPPQDESTPLHDLPINGPAHPLPSLGKVEPRLSLTFTCTADGCSTRSTHEFARRSYERGIVLVQCPGCKNRHLIADNLGWFKDDTNDGKTRTVEQILQARGESVRRGAVDADGNVEYYPEEVVSAEK